MNIEALYELKSELTLLHVNGLDSHETLQLSIIRDDIEEDCKRNFHPELENIYIALGDLLEHFVEDKSEVMQCIYSSLNHLLRINQEAIEPEEKRAEQVPAFSIDEIDTNNKFTELVPIISSLSTKRKERLVVIREARGKGYYQDFRMYPYLKQALYDNAISDEIEDIIVKEVGEKIFPFILPYFEYNDQEDNIHKFSILCKLNYSNIDSMIDKVLNGNYIALQIKAIEYMSNHTRYEDSVIKLCDSPHKPIREIAYFGLAKLKTEKAEKHLCALYAKAVKKKSRYDIDLLAKSISQGELAFSFDYFFSLVKESFDNLLRAGKKADSDMLNSLRTSILILKQKGRPEIYEFLSGVILNKEYNEIIQKKENALSKQAIDISYTLIDVIQEQEQEQLIAFYKKVIAEMPDSSWKAPFYKKYMAHCVINKDAAEVYHTFSPYYLNGNITAEDIANLYAIGQNPADAAISAPVLDERWIDSFYATMEHLDEEKNVEALLEALHTIEPMPSEKFNQSLISAGQHTKKYLLEITNMIMKRDVPDKYETIYSLIEQCHNRKDQFTSNLLRQLPRASYWEEFPKEYAAKFKELKNAPRAIFTRIENN